MNDESYNSAYSTESEGCGPSGNVNTTSNPLQNFQIVCDQHTSHHNPAAVTATTTSMGSSGHHRKQRMNGSSNHSNSSSGRRQQQQQRRVLGNSSHHSMGSSSGHSAGSMGSSSGGSRRKIPMRSQSYHRTLRTNTLSSDPQQHRARVPRRHSTSLTCLAREVNALSVSDNSHNTSSSNTAKPKSSVLIDYSRTRATHSRDANRTSCHGPTMSRNVYKQERRGSTGRMSALDWNALSSTLATEEQEEAVAPVMTTTTGLDDSSARKPGMDDSSRRRYEDEGEVLLDYEDPDEQTQQKIATTSPDSNINANEEKRQPPGRTSSARLRVPLARRPSGSHNKTLLDYSETEHRHRQSEEDEFLPSSLSRARSLDSSGSNPLLQYRRRSLTMTASVV